MATNDLYRVKVQLHTEGSPWKMGMYYREEDNTDSPMPARDICQSWDGLMSNLLAAVISSDCAINCIEARRIKPGRDNPYVLNKDEQFGLRPPGTLPKNQVNLVRFQATTPLAFQARSSFHIGGFTQDDVSGDRIDQASLTWTNMFTFINTLESTLLVGQGGNLGSWHLAAVRMEVVGVTPTGNPKYDITEWVDTDTWTRTQFTRSLRVRNAKQSGYQI